MRIFDIFRKKALQSARIIESQDEAHKIINEMQPKLLKIQKELDEKNRRTSEDLTKISKEIGRIANDIAFATGGEKRGL